MTRLVLMSIFIILAYTIFTFGYMLRLIPLSYVTYLLIIGALYLIAVYLKDKKPKVKDWLLKKII